jgi:flagellar hook-associated protein 1 FlgK
MPSTFFGFEIANSALQANQLALDVVSNNTSNINTPGYTRQIPVLSESAPAASGAGGTAGQAGQLGTGVTVASIDRVRDNYVDQRVWAANATQGSVTNLSDVLNEVQAAYNEPSTYGIGQQMTDFFNSFSDLSANPQSGAIRATVINNGEELANGFHSVSSALSQIAPEISGKITDAINTVNNLAGQIAGLNKQITLSIASGDQPNDLQDERGALLDQLSSLVNIQVTNAVNSQTGQASGAVNINVGGFSLVQDGTASTLPATPATTNGNLGLTTASGATIPLSGGEVYGLIKAGTLVQGYQADLDTLASNLISAVNTIHASGAGLDGSTGNLFFTTQPAAPGTGAAEAINVNPTIINDPNKIAAATAPIPPNTLATGNGDNASQIAALTSTPVINGFSLDSYYNAKVAGIGADAQTYQSQVTNQQNVVTQLQNLQSSTSGVNLDEELSNMMQYQRAYQAAARVLNTADSFLLDVINGLGSGATALA